jgi:uncharacterized protein
MKPSFYNLVVPHDKDRYLIFNSLYGSLFEVDGEGKEAVEGLIPIESLSPDIQSLLETNGVLVGDAVDELKIFSTKFDQFKYDRRGLLFTLISSYACNLACPYCYEGKRDSIPADFPLDRAETVIQFIIQKVVENNSSNLSFFLYGGEPLLRADLSLNIAKILKAWSEMNRVSFGLGMVTNATLLTSALISEFREFKSIFTEITLDGPESFHNKKRTYKNRQGTYRDIIDALKRCRNTNFDVKIRINVDQQNVHEIPRLLEDLRAEGLEKSRLTFSPLAAMTSACAHYRTYLDLDEIIAVIPSLWEQALQMEFRLDISPKSTPVYCASITDAAYVIDPFLDVYRCYGTVGLKEHRIGVLDKEKGFIKDFGYYDLLSRNPLSFKKDGCLKCRLLPMCGGGCALASHRSSATYHQGSCDFYSKIIEQRIRLYVKYRDRIPEY